MLTDSVFQILLVLSSKMSHREEMDEILKFHKILSAEKRECHCGSQKITKRGISVEPLKFEVQSTKLSSKSKLAFTPSFAAKLCILPSFGD